MEETEIAPPQACFDCIFQEILDNIATCRFYPKYKKIPYPLTRNLLTKPAFCRIKKVVVYEEPFGEDRRGFDPRD